MLHCRSERRRVEIRGRSSIVEETVEEFRKHDLLVQASALSFRVLVAAIPASLFVIGVLGALQLEELWRDEAAPELRKNVSEPVYELVNDAVSRVLNGQQGFWITIGALLAIGGMASIIDAVTRTLNRIHGVTESRSLLERATNAVGVGVLSGLLLLAALAVVRLGPFAIDALLGDSFVVSALSFVVRWSLAAALLTLVVVLSVRVAPDLERPLRRVGVGATITVAGWVVMSVLFGFYLGTLAQYDSVFGNLATLYVLVQYVALSAIVFVGGLVVDALAARRA